MATNSKDELQDLVDSPNETLGAEYKSWLDLADSAADRANTARHIVALANHGGGYIVFGFTDALQFAGANPFAKVVYNRDLIAGIVKKYLEPPFQCDVSSVASAAGDNHPIVIVPPHGSVPICAKGGGPEINGKPQGIVQGTYYIRKSGPESAPITTAAEWAPIIRRCAMHERAAIIGAVDAALRGGAAGALDTADALKKWHDAARVVFLKDIAKRKAPEEFAKWHWQPSYAIERSDGQRLNPSALIEVLRQVNLESKDTVGNIGWTMFYPFTRAGIAPYFESDPASGEGEQDFLECALLRDAEACVRHPDMWRVSPAGKATIIRDYCEDDAEWNKTLSVNRGTWLSPNMMARSLAEFVRHARGFSERFDAPTTVFFRCDWHGLGDRRFYDTEGLWMDYHVARSDHRTASGAWPVSTLANGWADIVAALAAPAIRAFTTEWVMSADWVRGQAPKWRR